MNLDGPVPSKRGRAAEEPAVRLARAMTSMWPTCNVREAIHRAALRLTAEPRRVRVTVQDLADAAGVPRGSIFTNVSSAETLLDALAGDMIATSAERARRICANVRDPAARLTIGMRLHVRYWSEEPELGRFILRHALSPCSMQAVQPHDTSSALVEGIKTGRFLVRQDQILATATCLVALGTSATRLVLEGVETWQNAGSDAAEFALVSLGLLRSEARHIARLPLPPESRMRHDE